MLVNIVVMLIGNMAAASSIFFIRASGLAPGYLAAYRLFFAVLLLTPLWLRDMKKIPLKPGTNKFASGVLFLIRHCAVPGAMLGVHFILWNTAARLTLAANASLLVNTVALFMPLVIFLISKERPLWQELCATGIAFGGIILLTFGDISLRAEYLRGNLLAVASMLFYAVYLALSKRNKSLPFWYYISGVYFFGALVSFSGSLFTGTALWSGRGMVEILPLIGLILIPTFLGHNLSNWAMRRVPSQLVSVCHLTQAFWAGILAWFIYGELPHPSFYAALVFISLGMGIITYTHHKINMEKQHESDLP